jgi:flagellar M-ring protein FliF
MDGIFQRILNNISTLWRKWSLPQRMILVGIFVAVIVGVVALFGVSSAPTYAAVIDAPIRDPRLLDQIQTRINQEGERTLVSPSGIVQVADEATAARMRGILIRENLIPSGIDPWAIFDVERWTITDWERNVNFRRAHTQMITNHIKALDDVDDANVVIVMPERTLFGADQNPVSASVAITPKPGSDILENRNKIKGIQRLLQLAIEGLKEENIVITDIYGNTLNDFAGMEAMDTQSLIERQTRFRQTLEQRYRMEILRSLQSTFGVDRVREINVRIEMDMSRKTVDTKEFFPFTLSKQTPGLAYRDEVLLPSVPRSRSTSTTTWQGTAFNPEGPTGVAGQVPPGLPDLQNAQGSMTQETNVQNEELNERVTQEVQSPQVNRVTVSVNIDGVWEKKHDDKGKPVVLPNGSIDREYTPIPPEDIRDATALIREAIGFNSARGDSVTVTNVRFDRSREHGEEDAVYFRQKQIQTTAIFIISGLTLLLVFFILFRIISRNMERRKRAEEEERARREQSLRDSAMLEAEREGVDVSISVEERTRMELMESVANLAKEHPEDCAQLIRTWLLEE